MISTISQIERTHTKHKVSRPKAGTEFSISAELCKSEMELILAILLTRNHSHFLRFSGYMWVFPLSLRGPCLRGLEPLIVKSNPCSIQLASRLVDCIKKGEKLRGEWWHHHRKRLRNNPLSFGIIHYILPLDWSLSSSLVIYFGRVLLTRCFRISFVVGSLEAKLRK